jgi:hypothetical protein
VIKKPLAVFIFHFFLNFASPRKAENLDFPNPSGDEREKDGKR